MDYSKNGGGGDELGKFWGGSKLFPKNWQKYAKIPYFSLFFSEIWGRGKFFLEKNGGGKTDYQKNGGEETDFRKNGGCMKVYPLGITYIYGKISMSNP